MYTVVSLIMLSVRYGHNDYCDKLVIALPDSSKFCNNIYLNIPNIVDAWISNMYV